MDNVVAKFERGGVNEFDEWEIWKDADYFYYSESDLNPCHHAQRYVDPEAGEVKYLIPYVVVAYNEGGHNYASICLDCIIEAEKSLREERNDPA